MIDVNILMYECNSHHLYMKFSLCRCTGRRRMQKDIGNIYDAGLYRDYILHLYLCELWGLTL